MGLFDSLFESESKETSSGFTAPMEQFMPHFNYLADLTRGAVETPFEMFPGQTYAGQTAAEQQAIEQLKAGAGAYGGMMGQAFDPAMQAYQSALGAPEAVMGMGLQDVASNPYLAAVSDAIQSRVNRNLQENIMPGLTRAGVAGGGLGGTRQGVAEGIAGRGTSEALAEQLAGLYGGAWQAGLGAETSRLGQAMSARQGAMGMAPGMMQTALSAYTTPAALLGQAGGLERAEAQRALDEEMSRFQFEQMEPWQRSQLAFNTIMPAATAFARTGSETRTRSTPSPFAQIGNILGLGGAIGGQLMGGLGGPSAAPMPIMGGPGINPSNPAAVNPYAMTAGYGNPYQFSQPMPANIGGGNQFNPWMWGG